MASEYSAGSGDLSPGMVSSMVSSVLPGLLAVEPFGDTLEAFLGLSLPGVPVSLGGVPVPLEGVPVPLGGVPVPLEGVPD